MWNLQACLNYSRLHAPGHLSQHKCAKVVADAIRAGGLQLIAPVPTVSPWPSAKDYGSSLEQAGFRKLFGQIYSAGDVVVVQPVPGHSPDGHIALFNGKQWVSDFIQADINPYRPAHPKMDVYRYGRLIDNSNEQTRWKYA